MGLFLKICFLFYVWDSVEEVDLQQKRANKPFQRNEKKRKKQFFCGSPFLSVDPWIDVVVVEAVDGWLDELSPGGKTTVDVDEVVDDDDWLELAPGGKTPVDVDEVVDDDDWLDELSPGGKTSVDVDEVVDDDDWLDELAPGGKTAVDVDEVVDDDNWLDELSPGGKTPVDVDEVVDDDDWLDELAPGGKTAVDVDEVVDDDDWLDELSPGGKTPVDVDEGVSIGADPFFWFVSSKLNLLFQEKYSLENLSTFNVRTVLFLFE